MTTSVEHDLIFGPHSIGSNNVVNMYPTSITHNALGFQLSYTTCLVSCARLISQQKDHHALVLLIDRVLSSQQVIVTGSIY